MAVKIVNANLDDEVLELANWLANEVGEYRAFVEPKNELLAFIYPSQLDELKERLEAINSDYFTDGTMKMEYNGSDLVIDVYPILKANGIEASWITDGRDD